MPMGEAISMQYQPAISACNLGIQSRHAIGCNQLIGHLLELGCILPQDHVTLPCSQHAEYLHHRDCDPQLAISMQ